MIVRAHAPSSRAARRAAHENLAAAGRVAGAAGVVGPFNPDLADVRIEQKSRDGARRVHGSLKRFVQLAARHVVGREERHADRVQARLDRDAWRRAAVAGRVRDFLVPIEQLHPLAVDRDLELLALDAAQDRLEVTGDALHLEGILAVGRELILDQDAAAGSERQPLDVIVLRGVRGHVEHGLRRSRHIANRQTADLSRSRQVRLHQRRRHRQRPRDVVEAARRIVGRQELRGIHFERRAGRESHSHIRCG